MTVGRAPAMTPRERLLAAFRRQACDSVPFAPVVEGYFQASLPGGFQRHAADISFELAGHALVRTHVLKLNTPLWVGAYAADLPHGIEQDLRVDAGDLVHRVDTPVGNLTCRLRLAPESPYMPWIIEYRIRTLDDLKTFGYLLEHTTFELWTDYFNGQEEYVGERGLVVVTGPPSPLQQMINFDMGLETVIYMLADHPNEMNEMLETFHAKQLEMWKAMAEIPAEICLIHDNLSSTTTSRAMYRRYDRTYVNAYADVLHAAGKKLITHWCGKLTAFSEDFAEARHDGVSEVAPPPTGDTDIAEARKTWAARFIMMGGIDPNVFAKGTTEQMEEYVEDLLDRMGPDRRGFILGSGDAVPFGTPPENLKAAAAVAARFPVD